MLPTAFLLVFAAVAALDGIYIHLWRLRLHARAASYAEHLWHTASAVLFVPVVALLFVAEPRGAGLWTGLGFLVAVHVIEVFDVKAEPASREALGGLSRAELAIHVVAVGTRTIAVGLLLASLPDGAWSLAAAGSGAPPPPMVLASGVAVLLGSVAIAIIHVWLAIRHCPVCAPKHTSSAVGA